MINGIWCDVIGEVEIISQLFQKPVYPLQNTLFVKTVNPGDMVGLLDINAPGICAGCLIFISVPRNELSVIK